METPVSYYSGRISVLPCICTSSGRSGLEKLATCENPFMAAIPDSGRILHIPKVRWCEAPFVDAGFGYVATDDSHVWLDDESVTDDHFLDQKSDSGLAQLTTIFFKF